MLWIGLLSGAMEMAAMTPPINLVQNGKSDYVIVYPGDSYPAEKHAAEELQFFIEQISGAKLPIKTDSEGRQKTAILLGATNSQLQSNGVKISPDDLGAEDFIVQTARYSLVLAGGRPRGTLYAVYAFLEEVLGCRWYSADVSYIPRKSTITIQGVNLKGRPAFEYREPFYTEAWDRDWAVRNRCNGSFMRLDDGVGGKIGYHPFVHSFYTILPPQEYFAEHPEYYSEIDGKRKWEGGQLCLTNPDVLRLTIERVRQWIKEHPEARMISVSQNDWYGYCTCANCKQVIEEEGAPSGLVLRFVNAVAEAIHKDHPHHLIDTLAYQWTEQPPVKTTPHKFVRVRMAPIGNCFAHPIDTCPENKKPYENLLAWSKITKNLYIWHYNTNFAHYLMPFPDFDEIEGTTRAYRRLGVKGIFYEGAYPPGGGGELAELRSWVMAKLLWNPELKVWDLIDEFLDGYYGKAAKPIRDYLVMMHEAVKKEGIHFRIYDHPTKVGYLRRDLVDRAESLFEQAEKSVASQPEVQARVQKARLAIDYTRLRQAQTEEERQKYARIVAEKIRRYGIGQVREGQPVEEFLRSIGQ